MNVQLLLNYFMNMPSFRIIFYGLPNLISQFNYLLGIKVPKLLERYGTCFVGEGGEAIALLHVVMRRVDINNEVTCTGGFLDHLGAWGRAR
jgi:hypothetical protein